MKFFVITLFPQMFDAIHCHGITGRAVAKGQADICYINPRDFTTDNYRRVDERPFGGGPGMVMMAEPLALAIQYAKSQAATLGLVRCPVVYLSPQGTTLSEQMVQAYTGDDGFDGMILLCGRYEGIDERLLKLYVDIELSIGDYVLSGGELPAMVLMDSVIRRLPNVMGDDRSAVEDSFVDGLLDCPHYTKPLEFEGESVPSVLTTGHHDNIAKWRFFEQLKRTQNKRPDLYQAFLDKRQSLDKKQQKWLLEFLSL